MCLPANKMLFISNSNYLDHITINYSVNQSIDLLNSKLNRYAPYLITVHGISFKALGELGLITLY